MEPEFHGASGAEGEIIDDHKAGDDLRKGGGSGGTCNAPAQHIDGNGIENDVQNAAGDGTEHHPPGLPSTRTNIPKPLAVELKNAPISTTRI